MDFFFGTIRLCFFFMIGIKFTHNSDLDEITFNFLVNVHNEFCDAWSNSSGNADDVCGFDTPNDIPFDRLATAPPERPSTTCCKPCSCHPDCIKTDTCCPVVSKKPSEISTRTTCALSQLRPHSDNYPHKDWNYLMLKGCSVSYDALGKDDPIRNMCEDGEEYNTLETKVPVTDVPTMAIYINMYCAICNDVLEKNIVHWSPMIMCVNDSLRASDMDNIVEDVRESQGCNLVYDSPHNVDDKRCMSYLSFCNVTGLWISYDAEVEAACEAYTSPYNFQYRNVFCYICNTDEEVGPLECSKRNFTSPGSKPVMVSFSAILRFKPRSKAPQERGTRPQRCNVNQMYDAYMEVCRNVTCFPPRVLINDTCTNLYESISGESYRFFIKLVPLTTIITSEILDLPIAINDYMNTTRAQLSLPVTDQTTHVFIKEKSPRQPEYYLCQLDVSIPYREYVSPTFIDQLLQIDNTDVSVITRLGYAIVFDASFIMVKLRDTTGRNELFYDTIQDELLRKVYPPSSKKTGTLNGNPLDGDNKEPTFESCPIEDDECASEERVQVLLPSHMCPLVVLSSSEFQIHWYNWGVYIDQLETNISRQEFVYSYALTRNKSVLVCKTFYKHVTQTLLMKYPKAKSGSTLGVQPQGLLSLVCTCLSVLCSVFTLITYILFRELRNQPGMNNVMLTCSLICAQILFQFGIGQAQNVSDWFCKTLGILIHFSWLVTLMWMNVCSLHMFRVFRSMRQISNSSSIVKKTLKYTTYVIAMAVIPIVINLAIGQYVDGSIGYGGFMCYITSNKMVGYLFALPVGLIVVVNMSLFVGVIITISKRPKIDESTSTNCNFAKIYIKISTLTGISWIFGFVFAFTELEVLEYVFIILNAGVGVFIFLSFVCNKRVLALYSRIIRSTNKSTFIESVKPSTTCDSRHVLLTDLSTRKHMIIRKH